MPSSCRLVVSPVTVVVPPVALLPLTVAVLTPVAVVVPHVAVLPLAFFVPPVAIVAASLCHPLVASSCRVMYISKKY